MLLPRWLLSDRAGLVLLGIWSAAPFIAYRISREYRETRNGISTEDTYALRKIARKTWRYFEEFTNEARHFLAPDNYQQDHYQLMLSQRLAGHLSGSFAILAST